MPGGRKLQLFRNSANDLLSLFWDGVATRDGCGPQLAMLEHQNEQVSNSFSPPKIQQICFQNNKPDFRQIIEDFEDGGASHFVELNHRVKRNFLFCCAVFYQDFLGRLPGGARRQKTLLFLKKC